MIPPVEQLTTDGYDLQFGTNVLGHFYFTRLLLPTIRSTVDSAPENKPRIVITASSAAAFTEKIRWETLSDEQARKKLGPQLLYAQSKLVSNMSPQFSCQLTLECEVGQHNLGPGASAEIRRRRHSNDVCQPG